jgi:hypothetical protein
MVIIDVLDGNINTFLISNFHRVLNIASSLLGVSPPSDFLMPMFQKHLSVPSSKVGYPASEGGTDIRFQNVGIQKSDVGDTPKRLLTI